MKRESDSLKASEHILFLEKTKRSSLQSSTICNLNYTVTTKHGEREKPKDFPKFDCDRTLSTNKSSLVHKDSSKEQFDFLLKSTGVHPMSLAL